MTMTIAGTTVPDPTIRPQYNRQRQMIGSVERTLNGARKKHVAAVKYRWEVTWYATTAEKNTLESTVSLNTNMTVVFPEGGTHTVQADGLEMIPLGGDRWEVRTVFEEV